MSTELATRDMAISTPIMSAEVVEMVLGKGDLKGLSPAQRVEYLTATCKSLHLNPLTQPLGIMDLQGRTVLYARKDCAEQLRHLHSVSVKVVSREKIEDLIVVTVQATTPDGRTDESVGAVNAQGLKGEALANAMMKAETKAKRRVTLSICGLGIMDESEVESVMEAGAKNVGNATPQAPWDDTKGMVAAFKEMMELLGEEEFYTILGRHGMEDGKQVVKAGEKKAREIYTDLSAKALKIRSAS